MKKALFLSLMAVASFALSACSLLPRVANSNRKSNDTQQNEQKEYFRVQIFNDNPNAGYVEGEGRYLSGERVTVSAFPNENALFVGWYDEQNTLLSSSSSYSFNINKNMNLRVTWYMTSDNKTNRQSYGFDPFVDLVNNTVTYGMYPQTVVTDQSLINALNGLDGREGDWCQYQGQYYSRIDSARPNGGVSTSNQKFDNGNQIVEGATYWFLGEPIQWRILSRTGNQLLLLSKLGLDASPFYYLEENHIVDGETIYQNNYAYSDVRQFINTDFYYLAFAYGNDHIVPTLVDNSAATTDNESNPYACGGYTR